MGLGVVGLGLWVVGLCVVLTVGGGVGLGVVLKVGGGVGL